MTHLLAPFSPSQRHTRALRRWLAAWFVLLCGCWLAPLALADDAAQVAVPPLTARVTDLTQTLSAAQRASLETQLAQYEKQHGSQIFILMVPSTAPETIDQYSIRVADAWKAGRKGIDDGVIVLIAKNNPPDLRRMRIETGLGVQGTLTDVMSGRILRDVMAPRFRQGDFYGGLSAGVAVIESLVTQSDLPAPASLPAAKAPNSEWHDFLPLLFILGVMVLVLSLERPRRPPTGGGPPDGDDPNQRVYSGQRGRFGTGMLGGGLGGFGIGGLGGWRNGGDFGNRGGDIGGNIGGGFDGGGGGGFDGGGASGNW